MKHTNLNCCSSGHVVHEGQLSKTARPFVLAYQPLGWLSVCGNVDVERAAETE
jgi:hypothetical protein